MFPCAHQTSYKNSTMDPIYIIHCCPLIWGYWKIFWSGKIFIISRNELYWKPNLILTQDWKFGSPLLPPSYSPLLTTPCVPPRDHHWTIGVYHSLWKFDTINPECIDWSENIHHRSLGELKWRILPLFAYFLYFAT